MCQNLPQCDRPHFQFTPNEELSQSPIAGMGIWKFRSRGSAFIDFFGSRCSHPLPPAANDLRISGTRGEGINSLRNFLVFVLDGSVDHRGALAFHSLDVVHRQPSSSGGRQDRSSTMRASSPDPFVRASRRASTSSRSAKARATRSARSRAARSRAAFCRRLRLPGSCSSSSFSRVRCIRIPTLLPQVNRLSSRSTWAVRKYDSVW